MESNYSLAANCRSSIQTANTVVTCSLHRSVNISISEGSLQTASFASQKGADCAPSWLSSIAFLWHGRLFVVRLTECVLQTHHHKHGTQGGGCTNTKWASQKLLCCLKSTEHASSLLFYSLQTTKLSKATLPFWPLVWPPLVSCKVPRSRWALLDSGHPLLQSCKCMRTYQNCWLELPSCEYLCSRMQRRPKMPLCRSCSSGYVFVSRKFKAMPPPRNHNLHVILPLWAKSTVGRVHDSYFSCPHIVQILHTIHYSSMSLWPLQTQSQLPSPDMKNSELEIFSITLVKTSMLRSASVSSYET